MYEVSDGILTELKEKLHILHDEDDNNLKRLLSFSYNVLKEKCGNFDIENLEQGKALVFERTRYEYNDKLEYFDENFIAEITSLMIAIEKIERSKKNESRNIEVF